MEEAVLFENGAGQGLVGVWHPADAAGDAARDLTVVMLHGWSGYRSGPHQMLTRAARVLAARGCSVLRFDFAGRGDSAGDTGLATLATMADDTRAALRWCHESGKGERFILLGLCSGCEVALATATEPGVEGLALWSAPVFAAGESSERTARKRADNLGKYAAKLLNPQTYVKLVTGNLDTGAIKKAVAATGGESKNVESSAAGHLPPGWRDEALERFATFKAPVLLVYGTADPTTEEALAWYRKQYRGPADIHLVAGANHSYYGLVWEAEVIKKTLQWLDSF